MITPGWDQESTCSGSSILSTCIVKSGKLTKLVTLDTCKSVYLYLLSDGSFRLFDIEPEDPFDDNSHHTFDFITCMVKGSVTPTPNSFLIKQFEGIICNTHTFWTKTRAQKEDWLSAYQGVRKHLKDPSTSKHSYVPPVSDQPHEEEARSKVTFEDFDFLSVLGKGRFGKVMLARDKVCGHVYALKILRKETTVKDNEVQRVMNECKVLQACDHPFIIKLKCAFQTKDRLCLVTQFACGGDLFFHFNRCRPFSEKTTKFYAAEIACGLGYLHRKGIIYRDLKLENVLLDRDGHVKLADFGLAKMKVYYQQKTSTFCGSKWCMAPEVIMREPYTISADWWSFGVLVYEMIVGRPPFADITDENLARTITTCQVRFPQGDDAISIRARMLIEALLIKNPLERLGTCTDGWEEVINHFFFRDIPSEDVVDRTLHPPFKPNIYQNEDDDDRYFSRDYTSQSLAFSPTRETTEDGDNLFRGFSYEDLTSSFEPPRVRGRSRGHSTL